MLYISENIWVFTINFSKSILNFELNYRVGNKEIACFDEQRYYNYYIILAHSKVVKISWNLQGCVLIWIW